MFAEVQTCGRRLSAPTKALPIMTVRYVPAGTSPTTPSWFGRFGGTTISRAPREHLQIQGLQEAGRARASIQKRVSLLVVVVVAVMLVDLSATVWGIAQLGDLNAQIQQKDLPVRAESDAMLVALINEETGIRGYLLTHDQSFQAPLHEGQLAYTQALSGLRGLVATDPGISANLDTLVAEVNTFERDYVTPTLLSIGTQTPAQTAAAATRGKVLFDQVRADQAGLAQSVVTATTADFSRASTIRSQILAGVVASSLVGIALAVLFLLLTLRAILHELALRRETEARLTKSLAKLEIVDAERRKLEHLRDDFIANAAHELRTPLTTLSGLGETLARHFDDMARVDINDAFAAMARQGERARVLIANLLDISNVEGGRAKFVIVDVDIALLVARVLEAAPPPDGEIVLLGVANNLTVRADSSRLEQVITNLLVNAYRYGGPDIRIDSVSEESRVVLSITDDGKGVAPEFVPKLFEPFTRGSQASTVRGSGIGLALCRGIVEGMGGEIWYDAVGSGGSSFRVSLNRMSESF
jgi:signal transduction histidine kinase